MGPLLPLLSKSPPRDAPCLRRAAAATLLPSGPSDACRLMHHNTHLRSIAGGGEDALSPSRKRHPSPGEARVVNLEYERRRDNFFPTSGNLPTVPPHTEWFTFKMGDPREEEVELKEFSGGRRGSAATSTRRDPEEEAPPPPPPVINSDSCHHLFLKAGAKWAA